ncbi:hypothetical protein PENSPDRAFT_273753 [Peniophora sp. CONT]|nr:hypothetical protein PENSPDRAFT_273753 [Peniophora sp. CONT]
MAPQGFYDPNAAQFAQWYHHMMLQQQQQQQGGGQRPPGPGQPPPHFPAFNHHAHNPFPSGTPPPAPQPAYARQPQQQQQQQQAPPGQQQQGQQNYDGFHPYRRPQRQNTAEQHAQFSGLAPAQPPYARGADAAGSSSSVNSTNSNSTGRPRERERTSSLKAQPPQHHPRPSPPPNVQQQRSRSQPAPSNLSRAAAAPAVPAVANNGNNLNVNGPLAPPVRPQPHSRTGSNSSTASARPAPSPTTSTSTPTAPAPAPTQAKPKAASTISAGSIGSIGVSPAPAGTPIARTPRPSPLGTAPPMSNADKRKSRDDSELLASGPPTNFGDGAHRPGGLKGKLRRALSLSAAQSIEPVVGGEDEEGPEGSAAGKKKRRALFNAKLNASTDNISLSSTMSSASVVIRKLGSLGKMARRNSIAGITSVFKGKKGGKEDDEDGVIVDEPPPPGDDLAAAGPAEKDKKKKDKKKGKASAKGSVAAPSVSAATVEVDRSSVEFTGLSPAAELARRHTLKANAQEAARIEADRRAAEAANNANAGGKDLPETWAKNTATRAGVAGAGVYRVNEAGERVLVEDAEVDGDDDPSAHDYSHYLEEDEGEWSRMDDAYEGEDGDGDETVRLRLRPGAGDEGSDDEDEDVEEWAVGLRRSVERTLVPQRGILKNARNYNQHIFLERTDQAAQPALRVRANSAEQAGAKHPPGALAHMPSSDPDHIDGLHRQQHAPSLPPLSFTDSPGASDAEDTTPTSHSKLAQAAQSVFSRPAMNSSAPVLSLDAPSPPTLTHRAATAPSKRLTFASNLSVYDTFPGQVYDRRSEPATWSRLTPALAQRIKEELNSFKMEEMEVHAASRIHTQFFV